MKLRYLSAVTAAATLAVAAAFAALLTAQSHPPATVTEETAAIQAIVAGEVAAWNHGDAKAFSAHYAEDGSFTNVVGLTLYGREAFEKQHDRIFNTIYKGSTNALTIGKIRFIRPDVAIVDTESRLSGFTQLPPGVQTQSDGAIHTKLQMVMTKEAGEWQISAFHNVAVASVQRS